MEFLRKPHAEAWLKLEDKEIGAILRKVDELPSFTNIISAINEFKNALSHLRGSKSQTLANAVHERALSLYRTFEILKADFLAIKQEAGKAEEIENFIADNFLVVDVMVMGYRRDQFYVNKGRGFVIGRANIEGLSEHFSRALLHIMPIFHSGEFLVVCVGSHPCQVESY